MKRFALLATCLLLVVQTGCQPADQETPRSVTGFVETGKGRIFYEMYHPAAPGVPLLLIHGGPGSTSCYFGLIDEEITDRPIIRYDQLGTGRSDRPAGRDWWNLPWFVSEVDMLRDALALDTLHILGSSWGGTVAAEYALTAEPTGVESLILAGPLLSTPRWLEDANYLVGLLPENLQTVIRTHEAAGTFDDPAYVAATDSFYARFLYHQQPRREVPECNGVDGNSDMYQAMWGPSEFTATGTLLEYDRTDRLHEIDLPVLLLAGEWDEARPETMHEFAALIPDATVEILPDAGHVSMVDQPEAFAAAIQAYMRRVEGQPTMSASLADPALVEPDNMATPTSGYSPYRPVATYSIVARDPETGQMGVAVQSHWFSVGPIVPFAEAGVGAVATQSFVDPRYGPLGLELMRTGRSAPEALAALVSTDTGEAVRQVGMVDALGRSAAHTGRLAIRAAGHHVGDQYTVQANMMENDTVWPAMAHAYEATEGDLAERLLAALEAAEAEGGDIRGKQSAAMVIVSAENTGRPWVDRVFDLRVEDHPEPVAELRRLVTLQRAYNAMRAGDDFLTVGEMEAALEQYNLAMSYLPDAATNGEAPFWVGATLASVDRLDEAIPYLRRAYLQDERWAELIRRLPEAELLPDDEQLVQTLIDGMMGRF
ncbi:MAG: proline iminopeptidase-family hydrolase [Rhodothermales bacterium]